MSEQRYLNAIEKFLPADTKDWTKVHFLFEDTCRTIDTLQESLVVDSRDVARRFTSFAASIELQDIVSPPTGYSALHDITANYAKLATRIDVLRALVRAELGKDANLFWAEINRS